MLSNRTLAMLTLSGLLLPVLLIAARHSDTLPSASSTSCGPVIDRLELVDNVVSLPSAPLLILGDSAVRNWPVSVTTLTGRELLLRDLRGLTSGTVGRCFGRLVAYYQPDNAIFMVGAADLNKLETELSDALVAIEDGMDHFELDMTLWVVGLLETPARDNERVNRLNRALAAAAARSSHLAYIDPNDMFRSDSGAPDPQWFWPDGDTLAASGYRGLITILTRHIKARTRDGDRL